jgi:hypothetical protein
MSPQKGSQFVISLTRKINFQEFSSLPKDFPALYRDTSPRLVGGWHLEGGLDQIIANGLIQLLTAPHWRADSTSGR